MGEWTIKTPNPKCRLFFKIGLFTDCATSCLTDFVDWRYIHSWLIFSTQFVYCCPSTFSLTSPPLPKLNVQYIQTVCGWEGTKLCCTLYPAGVLHSVSDQIQNLQNCFTTPDKNFQQRRHLGIVVINVPLSMVRVKEDTVYEWFARFPSVTAYYVP
jgi:hypothetical protein